MVRLGVWRGLLSGLPALGGLAALGALVVGALAAPPALRAQEAPRLTPGREIRITSPALVHRTAEGTLVERTATSLVFRPDGGSAAPVEVELAHVRRLEMATGSHRGILRGAFTGLWSGLLLGLIIYEADEADDEIDPECGDLQCFESSFFVAMSLGGAAAGAAVGSFFHVTEWTEVPLRGIGVSGDLVPLPSRGVGAGSRLAPSSASSLGLEVRVDLIF